MDIYRGDNFKFNVTAKKDGELFIFYPGDSLKVGIKNKLTNTNCELLKKILITERTDTVAVDFSHEETKKVCQGTKVLEVELTDSDGNVSTLYQGKINVKGDVINE